MGRQIRDITGQEFGCYTALNRLTINEVDQLGLGRKTTYWKCRCRCGTEKLVDLGNLVSGRSNSCGCARRGKVRPGARFEKLTVARLLDKEERIAEGKSASLPYWYCSCKCGGFSIQQTADLLSGKGHHCGCENSLVGQRFGRLRVLEDTGKRKGGSIVYSCRCTCGEIAEAKSVSLKNGDKKSCGCLRNSRIKDLEGKIFGSLTALYRKTRLDARGQKRSFWCCLCNCCGKKGWVQANFLTRGITTSCGGFPDRRNDPKKRGDALCAKKEKEWRDECFKRENYTCQITGKHGGALSAHHIFSFADYPKCRFDSKNGFIMEQRLHKMFHKKYGLGRNTREQLNEFIRRIK